MNVPLADTGLSLSILSTTEIYYGYETLVTISKAEAYSKAEAQIQLLEGCEYEFEITGASENPIQVTIANSRKGILEFSNLSQQKTSIRGRIKTGVFVGTLDLVVLDGDGDLITRLPLEVRSAKLKYREHYRYMLEYIADRTLGLVLELRSPASGKLIPDPGKNPETIGQRFSFLRSLIDSNEFRDAIDRITGMPYHRLEVFQSKSAIHKSQRPNRSFAQGLSRGSRRISVPDKHPLYSTGITSLPEYTLRRKRKTTFDTPENRFIKFALRSFLAFLVSMSSKIEGLETSRSTLLLREVNLLKSKLENYLNRPFFRDISDPHVLPLGSPVLQRRGGYRELLRSWILFHVAARLCWEGGNDVYDAGRKDVATLYEYWVFFRLLELMKNELSLDDPEVENLIQETPDGFDLKLKAGRFLKIEGLYTKAGRNLRVRFSYNRTFLGSNEEGQSNYPASGSWTSDLRPDYTLTFWPAEFTEENAERQELITHIHFDAKYRAQHLVDLFGTKSGSSSGEEMNEEKESQRGGIYKRVDLLKMHAYKDAIRRTAGAYVIYPGSEERIWRGFHEILPGLGAFPLRPVSDGDDGSKALQHFIQDVISHVCNKASQRERESYHRFLSHEPSVPKYFVRESPELTTEGARRHSPPMETTVLVGWVKNEAHLTWIKTKGLYNVRIDRQPGSIRLASDVAGAKYLLLHTKGEGVIDGLLEIYKEGPRVFSKSQLIKAGYPGKPSSDFYLVFDVRPHPSFRGFQWHFKELQERNRGRASAFPYAVTLTELLSISMVDGGGSR